MSNSSHQQQSVPEQEQEQVDVRVRKQQAQEQARQQRQQQQFFAGVQPVCSAILRALSCRDWSAALSAVEQLHASITASPPQLLHKPLYRKEQNKSSSQRHSSTVSPAIRDSVLHMEEVDAPITEAAAMIESIIIFSLN